MTTSQQRADILLAEHQANREHKMDLASWDRAVRPHLHFVEAGANMAARHASMLPSRPYFETHAEDELANCRTVLETALRNVIAAQAAYHATPVEDDQDLEAMAS